MHPQIHPKIQKVWESPQGQQNFNNSTVKYKIGSILGKFSSTNSFNKDFAVIKIMNMKIEEHGFIKADKAILNKNGNNFRQNYNRYEQKIADFISICNF